MSEWRNWYEIDTATWKLLPNHADLIGTEYAKGDATFRVVDVCFLFPSTRVEVQRTNPPGICFSAPAEAIRTLLKGDRP